MTWTRTLQILLLTFFMCSASGLLAMQKLRAADPAEVF
jgi:putative ABC transport system permease protein